MACCLTGVTALWLAAFVGGVNPANTAANRIARVDRLRDCVLRVWALVALVQLTVTVFGTMGLMPLTGVTFPLAGFGGTALMAIALFTGLAVNGTARAEEAAPAASHWSVPRVRAGAPALRWSVGASRLCQAGIVLLLLGLLPVIYRPMGNERFWHQAERHGDRADPWSGLPGCVVMREGEQARSVTFKPPTDKGMRNVHCADDTGKLLPATTVLVDSLRDAVSPLHRAPGAKAAFALTDQYVTSERKIAQGAEVELTLLPSAVARAQFVTACMTGSVVECNAAGIDLTPWLRYYESAPVKMGGLYVLDIGTGHIEALGSAHTACYEAQNSEGALPPACPIYPTPPVSRPYK